MFQRERVARSRAETFAAGTTAGRVGILHLEATALESFNVIQFASADIERAFGVNDHFDAAGFNEDIAIRRAILQVHLVLQPGAAAAHNRDTEYTFWTPLFGQQRADLPGGAGCDANEAFVANAKVWLRACDRCGGCNHLQGSYRCGPTPSIGTDTNRGRLSAGPKGKITDWHFNCYIREREREE